MLAVQGSWWTLPAPGLALCSAAVTQDPAAARVVLRAVFESQL